MKKVTDIEETNVGVHALLVTLGGEIVLQQRDKNPSIVYSGKISMFGGTIKAGEDLLVGLKRELLEELELDLGKHRVEKLGVFIKTKELDGIDYAIHVYLVFDVNLDDLTLHEGAGFAVGKADELLKNSALTRITRLALEKLALQTR